MDTVAFGPDKIGPLLHTEEDAFAARWQLCGNTSEGISQLSNSKNNIIVFPNPNNGAFTLQVESEKVKGESGTIKVYNMLGEKVYSNQFTIDNSPFTINLSSQLAAFLFTGLLPKQDN